MATVTFVEFNGQKQVVEANNGESLMEAAVQNGISGIDAICGGACACATCHVYIAPEWLDVVGQPSDIEATMIEDGEQEKTSNSRLACQVVVTESLHGLVVEVP